MFCHIDFAWSHMMPSLRKVVLKLAPVFAEKLIDYNLEANVFFKENAHQFYWFMWEFKTKFIFMAQNVENAGKSSTG